MSQQSMKATIHFGKTFPILTHMYIGVEKLSIFSISCPRDPLPPVPFTLMSPQL